MSDPTSTIARVKRLGRPPRPVAERFWEKIDRSGGPDACWPWTAGLFHTGYGVFKMNGRTRHAPAVAIELTTGRGIPDGMCACHSCDVRYPVGSVEYRKCCNPAHLWLGTKSENTKDMDTKGRRASGERSPSALHPEIRQGERNARARITKQQVFEIRDACSKGEDARRIAQRYGVSRNTIYAVATRRTWKSVP